MKKALALALSLLTGLLLTGCDSGEKAAWQSISAQEAQQLMESEKEYILLDVRTEEEYNEKHIPGAMLIPDYEVSERAEQELPQKDALILVYCRSGNRSKSAAKTLASLGYTNVREFGGILDWPYAVE